MPTRLVTGFLLPGGLLVIGIGKEPSLGSDRADLQLEVTILDGRKANIIASAMIDGNREVVVLAHECFGNCGAAENYLRQHREMLTDRARDWLSGKRPKPNEGETRRAIRREIEQRYSDKLRRLLLTGSRAKVQHVLIQVGT